MTEVDKDKILQILRDRGSTPGRSGWTGNYRSASIWTRTPACSPRCASAHRNSPTRLCKRPAPTVRRARGRHGTLVPVTVIVDLTPAARRLCELVRSCTRIA